MPRNSLRTALLCASLAGAVTGCGRDVVVLSPAHPQISAFPFPLALRGQNTFIRVDFPKGRQAIEPGQFTRNEVCYMKAGNFRIDCFADGSELNLGPMDSTDLLTDLACWNLQPADEDNRLAAQAMQAYALITLVAGSVDRLPNTLSDYLQTPGQHLTEALDLTNQLLTDPRVRFQGYAKGGNFTVTVELNDDGRQKLLDAVDEMGGTGGGVQFVRLRDPRGSALLHRIHERSRRRAAGGIADR
jgi:hypothetical protein